MGGCRLLLLLLGLLLRGRLLLALLLSLRLGSRLLGSSSTLGILCCVVFEGCNVPLQTEAIYNRSAVVSGLRWPHTCCVKQNANLCVLTG